MSKKQIVCHQVWQPRGTDQHGVEVNAELLGEKVDDLGDVVSEKIHEVKDKLSNKE